MDAPSDLKSITLVKQEAAVVAPSSQPKTLPAAAQLPAAAPKSAVPAQAQEPATSAVPAEAQEPDTSAAVLEPAVPVEVQEPATSGAVQQPATSAVSAEAQEPFGPVQKTAVPASDRGPATSGVVQEPAVPDGAQEPAASSGFGNSAGPVAPAQNPIAPAAEASFEPVAVHNPAGVLGSEPGSRKVEPCGTCGALGVSVELGFFGFQTHLQSVLPKLRAN